MLASLAFLFNGSGLPSFLSQEEKEGEKKGLLGRNIWPWNWDF